MCATTTSRLERKEYEDPQRLAANSTAREPGTKVKEHKENLFQGIRNRLFQHLARILPGARSLRVALHRARGVHIGEGVWIGYDVILDTSRPHLITIEDRASLSMRVTVIAHFRETQGVKIEQDAFIGPGAIILPNVTIGRGAVVTAGSVVTQPVPPMTLVQGNPAVPIASCGIPLSSEVTLKDFSRRLKNLAQKSDGEKA
jgi:acetyltransferase-like isoleucine patch superfamily enzyme